MNLKKCKMNCFCPFLQSLLYSNSIFFSCDKSISNILKPTADLELKRLCLKDESIWFSVFYWVIIFGKQSFSSFAITRQIKKKNFQFRSSFYDSQTSLFNWCEAMTWNRMTCNVIPAFSRFPSMPIINVFII